MQLILTAREIFFDLPISQLSASDQQSCEDPLSAPELESTLKKIQM